MTQPLAPAWLAFNDEARKRKFAALMRENPDTPQGRYAAACGAFPEPEYDNLLLKAADEYPYDRFVIAEMARLAKETQQDVLPSREQQARDIYNLAMGAQTVEEKLKAHKLYAELMGHITKPESTAPVQVNLTNRIMLLPQPANNIDTWEAEAVAHHKRLTNAVGS